jgi:hypothetical protein
VEDDCWCFLPPASKIKVTQFIFMSIIPYIQCSGVQTLLNLGSSMIEFAKGGYKPWSVLYDVIIPYKWLLELPFIACQGRGIVVYSLIVPGL